MFRNVGNLFTTAHEYLNNFTHNFLPTMHVLTEHVFYLLSRTASRAERSDLSSHCGVCALERLIGSFGF